MEEYSLITDDSSVLIARYKGGSLQTGTVECNLGICYLDYMEEVRDAIKQLPRNKLGNVARIVVTKDIRNQGIATKLLNMVCEKADSEGILLDLGINPYGDLNYKQLESFYKKFGFVRYKDTETYYRLPKGMIVTGL